MLEGKNIYWKLQESEKDNNSPVERSLAQDIVNYSSICRGLYRKI